MEHRCHANGCDAEAHHEVPLCKYHFEKLPEPHRKKLWAERPKGKCGACDPANDSRSKDWNDLFVLGIMIVALIEAPEYEPRDEWSDAQGFCWMGGFQDAKKKHAQARKIIERFNLK